MVSSRRSSWDEVTGLLLFFGGILLLLALLSFDPRDVPDWTHINKYANASDIPSNFVGRVGAVVAAFMYLLFGGASFFAAVGLLGLGIAKFTGKCEHLGIRFGWLLICVLSWSTLLDLQHLILMGWKQKFDIPGPGGWFGHQLNIAFGRNVFGSAGSVLIFVALALVSLILATGFHPIQAMRRFVIALWGLLKWLFLLLKKSFLSSKGEQESKEEIPVSPKARNRQRSSILAGDIEVTDRVISVVPPVDIPAPQNC